MNTDKQAEPTPREKFTAVMRELVKVPKVEILKREKEYKAARKRRKGQKAS